MQDTAEKTFPCPSCSRPMHFESRHRLEFVGGRGTIEADRFHCSQCRKFHNEPVEAPKKAD